ncbi:MAG: hypothetical protein GC164_07145 [Phycisphaera sp.]|nr:hypothetical protein [Phycisphaera sp.]
MIEDQSTLLDKSSGRASLKSLRTRLPDAYFVVRFMSGRERWAVSKTASVWLQLVEVAESCGEEGACENTSCAERGCESRDERAGVIRSITDYLGRGEVTGKPELDGFEAVVGSAGFSGGDLADAACAWSRVMEIRRVATWKGLRESLMGVAQPLARAVGGLTRADKRQIDHPTTRSQLESWCLGLVLVAVCVRARGMWEGKGALLLPLDDLVKCQLSESRLSGETRDECWRELMFDQRDRTEKLLRGGERWLTAVPDARSRRAVTLTGALALLRLSALAQGEPVTWGRRIAALPGAAIDARRLVRSEVPGQ